MQKLLDMDMQLSMIILTQLNKNNTGQINATTGYEEVAVQGWSNKCLK